MRENTTDPLKNVDHESILKSIEITIVDTDFIAIASLSVSTNFQSIVVDIQ